LFEAGELAASGGRKGEVAMRTEIGFPAAGGQERGKESVAFEAMLIDS